MAFECFIYHVPYIYTYIYIYIFKMLFFPIGRRGITAVWMHHRDTSKSHGQKINRSYTRMLHVVLNSS